MEGGEGASGESVSRGAAGEKAKEGKRKREQRVSAGEPRGFIRKHHTSVLDFRRARFRGWKPQEINGDTRCERWTRV